MQVERFNCAAYLRGATRADRSADDFRPSQPSEEESADGIKDVFFETSCDLMRNLGYKPADSKSLQADAESIA